MKNFAMYPYLGTKWELMSLDPFAVGAETRKAVVKETYLDIYINVKLRFTGQGSEVWIG